MCTYMFSKNKKNNSEENELKKIMNKNHKIVMS